MPIFETPFQRSLTLLREQGLRAVDIRSTDGYSRVLSSHIDILKMYLQARNHFTSGISTVRVTGAAFLGFESAVLYKIVASIDELVRRGIQTHDRRMISIASRGLLTAFDEALNSGVFPVFVKLIDSLRIAFSVVMSIDNSANRTDALETLLSAVTNFCSYSMIWVHLNEAPERIESLPSYGAALVGSLRDVLKQTIDRSDSASFGRIFDALVAMMVPVGGGPSNVASLEVWLTREGLNAEEQSELENRIRRAKEETAFYNEVELAKRNLAFDLGGWCIKCYDRGALNVVHAQAIIARVFPFFNDLAELSIQYLRRQSGDSSTLSWELEDIEGGAFSPVSSWPTQFYIIAVVRTLRHAPTARDREEVLVFINDQRILSDTLATTVSEIRKVSVAIADDVGKWELLVPEIRRAEIILEGEGGRRDRLESLRDFWQNLLALRQKDDEERLLDAPISIATRTTFQTELKKHWLQHSTIRNLAQAYGVFEDHTSDSFVPPHIQPWGLPRHFQDKMWFVTEHRFAATPIAENLGRNLGEVETRYAFEAVAANVNSVPAGNPLHAKTVLDDFLGRISTEQISGYVLLCHKGFDFLAKLHESEHYQPVRQSQDDPTLSPLNIRAKYRGVPIIEIWGMGPGYEPCGICVPIGNLGMWQQYWSDAQGNDLTIDLEEIDEHRAEEMLKANPRLALSSSGEPLPHDDAILRLRKKIIVGVWERFRYTPAKVSMAIRITVPTDEKMARSH